MKLTKFERAIMGCFENRPRGLTDKGIYSSLRVFSWAKDLSSVVSVRNGLVRKGLIKDSGKKRKNLGTEREAIVWLAR